jgi:transposase-like protein
MRYPAFKKLEIIRIVEQSHLPAKRTLDQLGIARRTFYRWYDRYLEGGPEALEDRPSAPSRVWNRSAPEVQDQIVEMALEQTELSPRELAVRFTDERQYVESEATVNRLLRAHDLITSPAYVVIKAADQFHTKTTRPNEMWQTDFTYFKTIGWGWMYLSTVLVDFSRYIIAWKQCTNMRAEDVTDIRHSDHGVTSGGDNPPPPARPLPIRARPDRVTLAMRTDLDHLPAQKQRELERVIALVFEQFEDAFAQGRILKVILYGSNARGGWIDQPHTAKGYRRTMTSSSSSTTSA